MADVARHPTMGRSAHPRHHNPARTSRPRPGHSTTPPSYAMDFIVQPPRSARTSQTLPSTIIVRLCTTNTDPDHAAFDTPNLVAVVALIPGDSTPADPALLHTLLAGQRIDSVHAFADDEADGSIASMDMAGAQGVGYMSFPALVVQQAGAFRLRITLLRAGVAVQIADSNVFTVR
ncbi:hypothetical protein C7974DRAFT_407297 [Boeremia exigua]|uniref:uncharacterized protein n=1 Tax=Boeremia exigua TaxID=749465 RepID=UPI001E8DCAAA|nr:uncharacterized protein C7974DRAFT_407297 [Boeremia exigua]KAH6643562.1 hypothetical protein C7974DRAFT_407297 [Boeremia exigua]